MTIEEFLLARIADVEKKLDAIAFPMHEWILINQIIANQRYIIEWHKNWPVLAESPPEYKMDFGSGDINKFHMSVTQQMAWLTQEEYRKKFGSEPPTAPLIREMASMYNAHPDWRPEWA